MNVAETLWRKRRAWSFSHLPPSRRALIHLRQDGRFLAFLLTSLHALGFGLAVRNTPFLYRELRCLRRTARIPFVFASEERLPAADLVITDDPDFHPLPDARRLLLDYDYFREDDDTPRMPYFVHPSACHAGLDQLPVPDPTAPRRHRIGFFGTHDPDFYRRHFHFPILDRTTVLEAFLTHFGDQVTWVSGPPSSWPDAEIVAAIDDLGGDRQGKSFLSQADYFAALRACDFVLSPPGWCMPLSHNLVEAMVADAVPITNAGQWMSPPLEDRVTCVQFVKGSDLLRSAEYAMGLSQPQIVDLRRRVLDYMRQYLSAGAWMGRYLSGGEDQLILVNAEECSVWTNPGARPVV